MPLLESMTAENEAVTAYFKHYAQHATRPPTAELLEMAHVIFEACLTGRAIYAFGNGACAALAAHMATDLGKGTTVDLPTDSARPRLRVMSLSDNVPLLTAYANDLGYERVYVEQLKNVLHSGDVVIALSGSGGSPNVLRALEYAGTAGARTLGMTGRQADAVKLLSRCEVAVQAPSTVMEQIEDWHVMYSHMLTVLLRERLRAYVEHGASLP